MAEDNACLVPLHHGPETYFVFKGKFERPKRRGSGPLGPFAWSPIRAVDDTRQRTHNRAMTQGMLNRVYPDAIEIGADAGMRKIGGIFGALFGLFLVGICVFFIILFGSGFGVIPPLFLAVAEVVFVAMLILSLLITSMGIRTVLWMPPDAPVLFNRRTRTVTAFHTGMPPFLKFWQKSNTRITTCDWDRVKVRTFRMLGSASGGMRCKMYLAWGEPDDPRRFADYTPLGPLDVAVDDALFTIWEFVRRYMEEDGPAIPPGEELGKGYNYPSPFPPKIIEAAGGQPYSAAEVRRLAGLD